MALVGVVRADPRTMALPAIVQRVLRQLGTREFLVLRDADGPIAGGKEERPNG
jgi:hypothetical protein